MARKTSDSAATANERRQKLAVARLEEREQVIAQIPEHRRIAQALRELGDSAQELAVRREILTLAASIQDVFERLEKRAEMLAGPGIAELLLPFGVQNRLREADFLTVEQVRKALDDGGSRLVRLPAIGASTCDLIRAHLTSFDAREPPPQKSEIPGKRVALTKRERVLAEKMGLSFEEAAELLKGSRQAPSTRQQE